MADHLNMTQANGWFKTSYADKIKDLTPEHLYYCKEAKPLEAERQPGGNYVVPITLTSEQGITKASSAAGAFALNPPVSLSTAQSSIVGSQFLLRSALDYETIMRSKNRNSFIAATKGVVKNMIKSAYFYKEVDIMWGRSGIGTIASIAGNDIVITTAQWAAGLWRGSENRVLRIETSAGVLRGTCSVTSYDLTTRTVTVDAAPAGTAATDVIFYQADGATGTNCMIGLNSAISATTGDLWGINRSTYALWRSAGTFSAGSAPLSFNTIMRAVNRAENNGLGEEINDIDCVVNTNSWRDLGNDLAALRVMDSSFKTEQATNGSEKIVFYCPAGRIHVFSHKFMKEGYAFIHPQASKWLELVGSNPKPTFALPGMTKAGEEEYLRPMENNAGVETRLYWNCAVFTTMINESILINNIVNAA